MAAATVRRAARGGRRASGRPVLGIGHRGRALSPVLDRGVRRGAATPRCRPRFDHRHGDAGRRAPGRAGGGRPGVRRGAAPAAAARWGRAVQKCRDHPPARQSMMPTQPPPPTHSPPLTTSAVGERWLRDVTWTVKDSDTVDPLLVKVPGGTRLDQHAALPEYLKLKVEGRRAPLVLRTVDTGSGDQDDAVTVAADHAAKPGAVVELFVASRWQFI